MALRYYFVTPATKETAIYIQLFGASLSLSQTVRRTVQRSPPSGSPESSGDSPICGSDEGASPPERGKAQDGDKPERNRD